MKMEHEGKTYEVGYDEGHEEKLLCEVCQKNEALGVASCIAAQPISVAYCRPCLQFDAEVLWIVLGTIDCCGGPENVADYFWEIRTFMDGRYMSAAQVFGRQKTMDMV